MNKCHTLRRTENATKTRKRARTLVRAARRGKTSSYPVTESVEIRWKDRNIELPAVVVAGAKNVLLGALPLEAMDLIVDPVRKQLTGAHGDEPLHVLC